MLTPYIHLRNKKYEATDEPNWPITKKVQRLKESQNNDNKAAASS